MTRVWKVKIWDGFSNKETFRTGTYDQISVRLTALPPACIWSAEPVDRWDGFTIRLQT